MPQEPDSPETAQPAPDGGKAAPTQPERAPPQPHKLPFVTILVDVAPDKMTACLKLSPVDGVKGKGKLTADHLMEALDAAEVARGIDKRVLEALAHTWDGNSLTTRPVARGADATPETVGPLHMLVNHLTLQSEIEAVRCAAFVWEVAHLAQKFQRVDPGSVIARRKWGNPSLLGYNVFGDPIEPPPLTLGAPNLDNIIEKNNVYFASLTYTTAVTGVAYLGADGEPMVTELNFDGQVDVHISPDKMTAAIAASPAGERGVMPSPEGLRELLQKNGVVYGIDSGALSELSVRFAQGLEAKTEAVVAAGTPPINGEDGRIEFSFNTDSAPKPSISEDGGADYKNINIVNSVKAGEVLAKLRHPTNGVDGTDVTGRKVTARNGRPVGMPVGPNTALMDGDKDTLIALIDGIARYNGSAVSVSEGYAISGNVDYSTGNVSYENSVAVEGDIKSGFEVRCGGDLQVSGIIEDCKVTVKENVLCKCGFVGNGKGIIEAGGDVSLAFMKNQTLVCQGGVNIAKEAINSNINARKFIKIFGHNLSAAGGTLQTSGFMEMKTVGNISGIKTTLQIDPAPEITAELAKTEAEIAQYQINIKKLTQTLETMPPAKKSDKEFTRKLRNSIAALQQQAIALGAKALELRAAMDKFEGSYIKIERCVYPGTIIKFGTNNMTVSETLNGKSLRVVEHEIKVM